MGVSKIWGEAERAGTVQPGENKAQGKNHLISVFKFLMRGTEKDISIVPSDRTRDSTHKHKYMKFLLNLFLWGLSNTGTCCPERLLSLHPCDVQTQTGHTAEQPALVNPSEQWTGLDDLQRFLPDSIILLFNYST